MKNIRNIFIVILLGAIVYLTQCEKQPVTPDPIITIVRDTVIDSISYPVIKYMPEVSYRDTGSIQWRFKDIDTLAILIDYFAVNFYADTILSDSSAFILIEDTIHQNRLWSRSPTIRIYPRTIFETTTIEQPTPLVNKYFYGINIGGSKEKFGFGPSGMLITKKDNAFTLSLDVISRDVRFGSYWKIKF